MITKFFEIRDAGTFIPVAAFKPYKKNNYNASELYLLRKAGFRIPENYVFVLRLVDQGANYDPHNWDGMGRTMTLAHLFIQEHFDTLASGDVIDVEFLLGITDKPKKSQRNQELDLTKEEESLLSDLHLDNEELYQKYFVSFEDAPPKEEVFAQLEIMRALY